MLYHNTWLISKVDPWDIYVTSLIYQVKLQDGKFYLANNAIKDYEPFDIPNENILLIEEE